MNISFKKGFTLIETLVTIAIFIVLMGGIAMIFKTVFSDTAQQQLALGTIDQARIAEFNFTNEIRNSGYGSDGSYPLNQAGDSQIIFYSSYGSNAGTINRLRYFASSTALYKGVIIPTGSPLSYNSNSEKITLVQGGLANGNTPEFYYYDGNYTSTSSPFAQPINVNQVKFVKISLVLQKQDTRTGTSTFPVNAAASMRNLKTNLGN
jgi:prepilin-type N-terminal cleavage/methylation domain-containing protein